MGNLTRVNHDGETRYEYDRLNRQIREFSPDHDPPSSSVPRNQEFGPTTLFAYDAVGNLVAQTNVNVDETAAFVSGEGDTTYFFHDDLNRQIATVRANGDAEYFFFDVAGNNSLVMDSNGNTTHFKYNWLDRIVEDKNTQGKSRTFTYDDAMNLKSVTDRRGWTREFQYDGLDRVTLERWKDTGMSEVNVLEWTYDEAGRVKTAADGYKVNGEYAWSVEYTYDGRDRVKTLDYGLTRDLPPVLFAYGYADLEDDGKWTRQETVSVNYPGGPDNTSALTTFQLDHHDRLQQVIQHKVSGNDTPDKRFEFTYNDLGQLETVQRYADTAGGAWVTGTQYDYEGHLLKSIEHSFPGPDSQHLARYGLQYDHATRVKTLESPDGQWDYQYDAAGQLASAGLSAARVNTELDMRHLTHDLAIRRLPKPAEITAGPNKSSTLTS